MKFKPCWAIRWGILCQPLVISHYITLSEGLSIPECINSSQATIGLLPQQSMPRQSLWPICSILMTREISHCDPCDLVPTLFPIHDHPLAVSCSPTPLSAFFRCVILLLTSLTFAMTLGSVGHLRSRQWLTAPWKDLTTELGGIDVSLFGCCTGGLNSMQTMIKWHKDRMKIKRRNAWIYRRYQICLAWPWVGMWMRWEWLSWRLWRLVCPFHSFFFLNW
jgi:hypothetical protein